MPGIKSTNEELDSRRERCVKYYITTLPTYTQFVNWYQEAFGKGISTAKSDWSITVENVAKESETSTNVKRWRRIAQLEEQYKGATEAKEKANIVMMAAKLEGIDVNKHEIDAHVNGPKSIFKIDLDNEETKEVEE